jgi:hypothetical protein
MEIAIMDYLSHKVIIKSIPSEVPETEIESWLSDNGYDVDNIHWMAATKINVEKELK